ncbi:MAG: Rv0909 family putative TA system antitoxin [Mycobacteriales bacterium]
MALLDKIKDMLKGREGQVRKATDKVGGAVGKVGEFVDEKTKGKYSDKIQSAEEKAAHGVQAAGGKLADLAHGDTAGSTPGATGSATDAAGPTTGATSDAATDSAPKPEGS